VVKDESLMELAAAAPTDAASLARVRGFPRGLAEGRAGAALIAALREAEALPEAALPEAPERRDGARPSPALVALLKVLLAARCEEHHVAQKLVATSEAIESLALGEGAGLPVLQGWRRRVFGEDALRLREGRLALGVAGKRIVLVPLGEPAPTDHPAS
jgi:ribonuclease D